MATQVDYWGEIVPSVVKTPVSILREQAALLGTKTQNLVEARVNSGTSTSSFVHAFNLVVPSLDYYTYHLFSIRHEVTLYPVEVYQPLSKKLQTEDEFVNWLRERLSSPETKKIIGSLLAQVTT